MPVLSITPLLNSLPELRRVHLVLTYLLHFYVHSHAVLLTPRTTPLSIPPSISVPLLAVCPLLGLPPILTYADTVLYNTHPANPSAPPSFQRNPYVKALVTFTNTPDEAHFYLASTRCEFAGVHALSIMRASLDEAFMADSLSLTRLTGYLEELAAVIDHIGDAILDMRNGCDPAVFYHLIRPWFKGGDSDGPNSAGWAFLGVDDASATDLSSAAEHDSTGFTASSVKGRKFSGPSAGQSTLIHALDVFLTVDHTPKEEGATAEETFMTRMLQYMPAPHRAFLQHLAHVPHPIRDLVTANRTTRPALVQAYDHALEALQRLREKHMRIATQYIIQQARRPPTADLVAMGALPAPGAQEATSADGRSQIKLTATSLSEIIRDEERVRHEQEEGDDEVRGTGGTALIKFLKMCRDNTVGAKLAG
jgi:indoleamine 2,3-dioxygenase